MARLFDMYKDTTSPDVYNSFRQIRQETEANRDKTMGNVGNILTSTNLGRLQREYREGSGRYAGITDPDKKFQVYYDVVRAIDPKEAEIAKVTYAEERNRAINKEISDAYKGGSVVADNEISQLEQEIKSLEQAIANEEQRLEREREQQRARYEQIKANEANMVGYIPTYPDYPYIPKKVANISNIVESGRAETNTAGYNPNTYTNFNLDFLRR